jgi:hypothetical protein
MTAAHVDTSCLVAIAFGEPEGEVLARRLAKTDRLFASNVLEAETRATFMRESIPANHRTPGNLAWILPDRSLGPELGIVLNAGYLRGADLWRLACAYYLAGNAA